MAIAAYHAGPEVVTVPSLFKSGVADAVERVNLHGRGQQPGAIAGLLRLAAHGAQPRLSARARAAEALGAAAHRVAAQQEQQEQPWRQPVAPDRSLQKALHRRAPRPRRWRCHQANVNQLGCIPFPERSYTIGIKTPF